MNLSLGAERGLTLTERSGALVLSGELISTTLSEVVVKNSPDVKSINGSNTKTAAFWNLGTWQAPQGGHMLRLRVTYCGYGYAAKYGAKVYYMPIDLNILIHTLDGVRIPTSSSSVQSGAFGYAWFICGYAGPVFVYVSVDPNNIDSYQIYLYTDVSPGYILIEASTTATWTPSVTQGTTPPISSVVIQCIPVQTHMSTTSTYVRSPPTMPFTVVP
jgi:hypothetical protein